MINSWWVIASVYVGGVMISGFILASNMDDMMDAALSAALWPFTLVGAIFYLLAIGPRLLYDKLRGRA